MANNNTPPKKGPHRMATAHKPRFTEIEDDPGLDADLDAFVKKVHSTIQDARSKMTAEEIAKADAEAKVIFDRASAAAKSSRHSA
jgi:hypothetical protein